MTIDGSLKYTINEHWEVSLEGLNLTDEYTSQWVDKDADRALFYHHTGRTFLLGARMKL
jgi:outer membrane receptor protein involved in Fe transport